MLAELLPIIAISFTVFVLFFLLMGVGYLVNKKPLKGSCGGVATLMGDKYCQFCGNDPNLCETLNADPQRSAATDFAKFNEEVAKNAKRLGTPAK